jgi:hypothetical protein
MSDSVQHSMRFYVGQCPAKYSILCWTVSSKKFNSTLCWTVSSKIVFYVGRCPARYMYSILRSFVEFERIILGYVSRIWIGFSRI